MICAVVIQPEISVDPIEFPFEVEFAANDGVASKYY